MRARAEVTSFAVSAIGGAEPASLASMARVTGSMSKIGGGGGHRVSPEASKGGCSWRTRAGRSDACKGCYQPQSAETRPDEGLL
jgi:hypothetical protein